MAPNDQVRGREVSNDPQKCGQDLPSYRCVYCNDQHWKCEIIILNEEARWAYVTVTVESAGSIAHYVWVPVQGMYKKLFNHQIFWRGYTLQSKNRTCVFVTLYNDF